MEKEKRKRVIKIVLYVLFGLAVAAVIALSIAANVMKDKTDQLNKKNKELENLNLPVSEQIVNESNDFIAKFVEND